MKPSTRYNWVTSRHQSTDKVRNSQEKRNKSGTIRAYRALDIPQETLRRAMVPLNQHQAGVVQGSMAIKRLTPVKVDRWGVEVR